jgi:predicted outer membrane protein
MLPFQNSSELHIAFYKKAVEIGSLSKMISGYLNADLSVLKPNGREDDSIYFSGDIIRQSDSLAPHIMRVEQERYSEQKYQHVESIRGLTNRLFKNCRRLEKCNSDGREFLSILKIELRKFKKLQKNWMLTI